MPRPDCIVLCVFTQVQICLSSLCYHGNNDDNVQVLAQTRCLARYQSHQPGTIWHKSKYFWCCEADILSILCTWPSGLLAVSYQLSKADLLGAHSD